MGAPWVPWLSVVYAGRVPDQMTLKRSYSVPVRQYCIVAGRRNDREESILERG